MSIERESVEYLLEIMNERIEFLTDTLNENDKEIAVSEGYTKARYMGFNMARQSEIDFIKYRIKFLNKLLDDSEKAV